MHRLPKKRFSGRPLLPACLLLLLLLPGCGRRPPRHARPLPLPAPVASQPEEPTGTAAPAAPAALAAPAAAAAQMSEAERKAAARALYSEGVQQQERGDCANALQRFESAERLFGAPTHLLHIAQCQASTGRLVEAQESYATLEHLALPPQAPDAFRQAQATGHAEKERLAPRIPTLRVQTNPPAASLKHLVVDINGTQMPADLLGIARPLNPGRYRVRVNAEPARSGVNEVELKEGEAKTLEVRLSK